MAFIDHPYVPTPAQREIHNAPERFKVLNTGRRFGKSTWALNHAFKAALEKPGRYWIIAPTYRQAKDIYWTGSAGLIGQYIPQELIIKKNDTDMLMELHTGKYEKGKELTTIIELKGADNPDRLRGNKIDGVILDEFAFMKPFVWNEIIEPILAESGGWAVFISTPRGFNHFYDISEHAKKTHGWRYFHYTCYDNPYFPKKELDRIKSETPDDTWAQEYMGEFTKNAGLVYKEFELGIHTIKIDQPKPEWVKYRCIDFGQTNPTAVLWIGVDVDGNIYVYDEMYRSGLRTSELAHLIHAKSPDYYAATWGDSAAAQSIKDLEEHGIYVQAVSKEKGASREDYVKAGIEKVKELLKVNRANQKPQLYVATHCQNLIDEFLSYEWETLKKEQEGEKNNPEKPRKVNDHALDALRMFIYEYKKPMKYTQQTYTPSNSVTGY